MGLIRTEKDELHLEWSFRVHSMEMKSLLDPFTPESDLIDFTLSNARRFYSSKGDPFGPWEWKD